MSGRYPWDIEDMHMMYGECLQYVVPTPYTCLMFSSGDVVRIGPNELTFATVQSFNGAYESCIPKNMRKSAEQYVKTYMGIRPRIAPHSLRERSTSIRNRSQA